MTMTPEISSRQGGGKRDAPAHAAAARGRKRWRLHRARQGRRRLDDYAPGIGVVGAARQDARLDASLAGSPEEISDQELQRLVQR